MAIRVEHLVSALFTLSVLHVGLAEAAESSVDEQARTYLQDYFERAMSLHCNQRYTAEFKYLTNITNKKLEDNYWAALEDYYEFQSQQLDNISHFLNSSLQDPDLRRQFKLLHDAAWLNSADRIEISRVVSRMTQAYRDASKCYNSAEEGCTSHSLPRDRIVTFQKSCKQNRDACIGLVQSWKVWRDTVGPKLRPIFIEYVNISNHAARNKGFSSMNEPLLSPYDTPSFKEDLENIWKEVKTKLYEPLYDYVRYRLTQKYSGMDPKAPIPAVALNDSTGVSFRGVLESVLPYPNEKPLEKVVTDRLKFQTQNMEDENHRRRLIFQMANSYFTKMGLADMSAAYGGEALIVKPTYPEVDCKPSAWDMCDGKDFRIKMCTDISFKDLATATHELGHIQYMMQYRNLSIAYRDGANPGFHEAIGDLVVLSALNPKNLIATDYNRNASINYLMSMAVTKVSKLPFLYLLDVYRWKVFSGEISTANLTYHWVKMVAEIQGLVPPYKRTEEDFDPAVFHNLVTDKPTINYFVSTILLFQLHKKLCENASHSIPVELHECTIGKDGGELLLRKLLRVGRSKPWNEILHNITGESKLSPAPMLEYFKPLLNFIKSEQEEKGYPKGWEVPDIHSLMEPIVEKANPDGSTHGKGTGGEGDTPASTPRNSSKMEKSSESPPPGCGSECGTPFSDEVNRDTTKPAETPHGEGVNTFYLVLLIVLVIFALTAFGLMVWVIVWSKKTSSSAAVQKGAGNNKDSTT